MVYAFGLNVKGLFPGMHFAERVQLLSWLLQFPNKGPCMLLAHACLWPLPGLCPRGQRLRTPAMPAQLPLWKRDGMLGMLSKALTPRPLGSSQGSLWCVVLIQCLSFPLEPRHFIISPHCLSTSLLRSL